MPHVDCKVAIIGGGVLGMSVAYFLSAHAKSPESIVCESRKRTLLSIVGAGIQAKSHAPFLYDPIKKKTFAKAWSAWLRDVAKLFHSQENAV